MSNGTLNALNGMNSLVPATSAPPNRRHYLIAHMLAIGCTPKQISEELQISTAQIKALDKNPEFRLLTSKLTEDVGKGIIARSIERYATLQERFDLEAPKAFDRLVEIAVMSEVDSVKLNANLAILNRSTNAPKEIHRAEVDTTQKVTFELPFMQNLLQTAHELGAAQILHAAVRDTQEIDAIPDAEFALTDMTEDDGFQEVRPLDQVLQSHSNSQQNIWDSIQDAPNGET